MKKKIYTFTLLLLVTFALLSVFFFLKKKNNSENTRVFKNYHAIPDSSGIFTSIPDFFPTTAYDILFYIDVDSNSFSAKFSLDNNSNQKFERLLTQSASLNGRRLIKENDILVESVWCLNGFLEGETPMIYLIGRYKNQNTYYMIPASRAYSFKSDYKDKIAEAAFKYCEN